MRVLILLYLVAEALGEDYYQTLGLRRDTPFEDVHKRFRELSRKYHPDKNKSPDAEQQYKKIVNAFEQIRNN